MGTGSITVELCSLEISVSVWKSLSCNAVGLSSLSAACLRRCDAWYSPSAAMIFARRSRSLSACLAIARCICCGISTSLTSTTLTLIPQGSVCSSMIVCSSSFICSRLTSRSSRSFCPRTLLSVVWEIWLVARMWFSTSMTDLFGSITLKYNTASTRAGTLSRVMTSCGGTPMLTVRRSIFIILSTTGTRRIRPGPLAPSRTLPSLKTTPRSYSWTMRTALARTNTTNNKAAIRTTNAPNPATCANPKPICIKSSLPIRLGQLPGYGRLDGQYHDSAVPDVHHLYLTPYSHRLRAVSLGGILGRDRNGGLPQLAVHEHPTWRAGPDRFLDDSYLPDHPFRPGRYRPLSGHKHFPRNHHEEHRRENPNRRED